MNLIEVSFSDTAILASRDMAKWERDGIRVAEEFVRLPFDVQCEAEAYRFMHPDTIAFLYRI